jgi:NAD dependent epimerase/dehydratase family enzyme
LSDGIKVEPRKLAKNGYHHKYTDIEKALKNILMSN